jgi:hypothetical protein
MESMPFSQFLAQATAQQQDSRPVLPKSLPQEPDLPSLQPGFLSAKPTAANSYCTVLQYMQNV